MNLTSVIGFLAAICVVIFGIWEAGIGTSVFNLHGLVIVVGGTMASVTFHCHWEQILRAGKGLIRVFKKNEYEQPQKLILDLSTMATSAKQRGIVAALREAPRSEAGGFMGEAVDIALDNMNDPDLVRTLLERRIQVNRIAADESVNVYRVASILSPMFGLIGTLLGIIQVLKNISDPNAVGVAMAVAISSALFGIALANIVFVPVAGKLRSLNQDETVARAIVLDGLIHILKGELPLIIEQRLWSLLQTGKKG